MSPGRRLERAGVRRRSRTVSHGVPGM
jgi:hypothetical protein